MKIYEALYLISAFNGFFMSGILFFQKRGNRQLNILLIFLLLILSIFLGEVYLANQTDLFCYIPHFYLYSFPLLFLIGPIYYLYTRSLILGQEWKDKKSLTHFLPLCVGLLILSPYYFLIGPERIEFLKSNLLDNRLVLRIVYAVAMLLMLLQNGIYLWLSWRLFRKQDNLIKHYESNSSIVQVSWAEKLTIAFMWFFTVEFITFFFLTVVQFYPPYIDSVFVLLVSLMVLLVAFYLIKQPEIYIGEIFKEDKTKYKYSSLSSLERKKLIEQLDELMKEKQPYLDANLKMPELALMMSISNNQLSQIINQEKGVNFFDYVNTFRIEAAKKRLIDPAFSHLTISAIALDVGFSSKTSFYRIFKKHCQMTPATYIKMKVSED